MKTFLCIIALFFLRLTPSSSQSYTWAWAKGAGGYNTDEIYGITTDNNNNIYVTGMFQSPQISFDTVTVYNNGASLGTGDLFVFKFDALGNALWGRGAGGLNNDCGRSIATDEAGNVYITGNFASDSLHFGDTTLVNLANGLADMMVVKYDAAGNELWSFNAQGIYISEGIGIAADPTGSGYVTGNFTGTMSLGDSLLTSHGMSDIFTARFTDSGTVAWAVRSGGYYTDFPHAICLDQSGNAFITGSYSSLFINFGNFVFVNTGDYDVFIAKYDIAGNVPWALVEGGPGEDAGKSICTDQNGNVYLTGGFASWQMTMGSNTFINQGGFDMFIVKYDSAGVIQWSKHAGQSGYFDWGYGVQANQSGLFVSGLFTSDTLILDNMIITNSGIANSTEVFVANYDFAGNLRWATSGKGNESEDGACLALDSLDNCYLAGGFSGNNVYFGNAQVINSGVAGNADTFLAKMEASGVSITETTYDHPVKIFPNPCGDYFYIAGEASAKAKVILYNMMGEQVLHRNLNNDFNINRIDCKNLAAGIYTLTCLQGEALLKGMVVKK